MHAGRTVSFGLAGALCLALAASTPPATADDGADAVVELGRRLFFDTSVSRTGTVACSSCHDPEHGFSDARVISADETGPAPRHSQTVLNLTNRSFHWDGEFKTLEELVAARVAPPTVAQRATQERVAARHRIAGDSADPELLRRRNIASTSGGYPGLAPQPVVADAPKPLSQPAARHEAVTRRLAGDGRYDSAFRDAFGSNDVTTDRIGTAIAAYLKTLRSTEAPYDAYAGGEAAALTPSASRGHELFTGQAGCASCHTLERDGAEASRPRFRNTGVAAAQVARRPGAAEQMKIAAAAAEQAQKAGKIDLPGAGVRAFHSFRATTAAVDDAGRAGATLLAGDRHKFKVPNLRDVALRPPYMHDGSLATLADVVDYYDAGGTPDANLHGSVKPLGLDAQQKQDLVAFLESLTGSERAGVGPLPADRPERHEVRIVDLAGNPLPSFAVTVRPTGDRLAGTTTMPAPYSTTTRPDGTLSFPFPASTHVVFEADGHEIGVGRPMPDSADGLTLRATPSDTVSVRVRRKRGDPELPEELRFVEAAGLTVAVERSEDTGARTLRLVNANGETVTFQRVAVIGDDEALYAAPAKQGAAKALMNIDFNGQSHGSFEVDLSGGASGPIDMDAPQAAQTAMFGASFDHKITITTPTITHAELSGPAGAKFEIKLDSFVRDIEKALAGESEK